MFIDLYILDSSRQAFCIFGGKDERNWTFLLNIWEERREFQSRPVSLTQVKIRELFCLSSMRKRGQLTKILHAEKFDSGVSQEKVLVSGGK